MALSEEKKQKIINKIATKLNIKNRANITCSVCGNTNFTIADGFNSQSLQDNIQGGLVIGGPALPNCMLICNHCGNTLYFNLGILGEIGE